MEILIGIRVQKLHLGIFALLKDLSDFIHINKIQNPEIIFLIADLHSIIDKDFYKKEFVDEFIKDCENLEIYLPRVLRYYLPEIKEKYIRIEHQYEYHRDILMLNYILQNIISYSEIYSIPSIKERHESKKFTPIALYNYPILQYSDILFFNPDIVFMGKDQMPNMKIFNKVKERFFNFKLNKLFDVCEKDIRIYYSDNYILDINSKKIGNRIHLFSNKDEIVNFFKSMASENRKIQQPCTRNCNFYRNISSILKNKNYNTNVCLNCKEFFINKIEDVFYNIKM